jgi:mRNA interferase MazF
MELEVRRGDIWLANLGDSKGSIQSNKRPCIIISNEGCNCYSPTITVVSCTGQINKKSLPTHTEIGRECGLIRDSLVLGEQIGTVNKSDLLFKVGSCTEDMMARVERVFKVQTGLTNPAIDEGYIMRLLDKINKKEKLMHRHTDMDNDELEDILDDRNMYIADLKRYCREWDINYDNIAERYIHNNTYDNEYKVSYKRQVS